jgi:putative Holliday junction resolvase
MDTRAPILGIDYGLVRVGLARTDETGSLAVPVDVLGRTGDRRLAAEIARRAEELGARLVVIGIPLRDDEKTTPVIEGARRLGRLLGRGGRLEVRYVDESLSSAEVDRVGQELGLSARRIAERRDALAAAVILRRFLDESEGDGR